jgi:hypothetical protein
MAHFTAHLLTTNSNKTTLFCFFLFEPSIWPRSVDNAKTQFPWHKLKDALLRGVDVTQPYA